MNIDWKSRITNKTFWVSLISLFILLSQEFGVDLTTIIPKNYVDIINTIFAILALLGIVVDPSTEGISDAVKQIVQVTENKQEVKEEPKQEVKTVVANNTKPIDTNASSKITVDNPDNVQAIGTTVNHISANMPQ